MSLQGSSDAQPWEVIHFYCPITHLVGCRQGPPLPNVSDVWLVGRTPRSVMMTFEDTDQNGWPAFRDMSHVYNGNVILEPEEKRAWRWKSSTHVDGHKKPSNMSTVPSIGRQPLWVHGLLGQVSEAQSLSFPDEYSRDREEDVETLYQITNGMSHVYTACDL